jgi:hypothetical protein
MELRWQASTAIHRAMCRYSLGWVPPGEPSRRLAPVLVSEFGKRVCPSMEPDRGLLTIERFAGR